MCKTGDRVTYSVAPWVSLFQLNILGFDNYYWDIPTGVAQNGVLYYSADQSSVTFIVGNDFKGKTIAVRMGDCNQSTQTPLTLTMKAEPEAPVLSGGLDFAQVWCLPFGAGEQTITLTNTDTNCTYIWENLEEWGHQSSYTLGQDYTLTFTPQNDARTLKLKVISSCKEQVYELNIDRSLSASVNSIETETGGTCIDAGMPSRLMLTNVDEDMPIQWTITNGAANGWSFLPGTETSARPYIIPGTGSATITATSTACSGTVQDTFSVNPKAPSINSATPLCLSGDVTTMTFNLRQAEPGVSYAWDYPSDWIVTGATDQSSITLIMNTSGKLKVRAVGCSSTNWGDSIDVAFEPKKPVLTPISCVTSGMADTITLSVVPEGEAAYEWAIPANFGYIIASNSDSSIVDVHTYGNNGDFTVSTRATTACGVSDWTEDTITVASDFWIDASTYPAGRLVSTSLVINSNLPGYDINNPVNFANLCCIWYVNGQYHSEGQPNDYITLSGAPGSSPAANGTAYVIITTPNGCQYKSAEISWPQQQSAPKNSNARMASVINQKLDIVVAPNPAQDRVIVKLPTATNGSIYLIDIASGKLLRRLHSNSLDTEINVSDIPSGSYVISVEQNGKRYSKQLIISK